MKKTVMIALALATLTALPAHAISAKYRVKLERSGCTQVTESNGTCDINKTKAQNIARHPELKAKTTQSDKVMRK